MQLTVTGKLQGNSVIVPHGINPGFTAPPRPQRASIDFKEGHPCTEFCKRLFLFRFRFSINLFSEFFQIQRFASIHLISSLMASILSAQ